MKRHQFSFALLLPLIFLTTALKAQQTDDLINILLKKQVITKPEADSLRAEQALKDQKRREAENQHHITVGSGALEISGLVQARYQGYGKQSTNNSFDLHRARLDAKGNLTSKWSYEIYTEFAASTKLLDAYMSYKIADFLQVQAGQFKVPFSYESLVADSKLELIDRSQAVEALAGRTRDVIGNENGRDIGVQVSGDLAKVNDFYLFDYTLGIFNGAGYDVTADNNGYKDIAARLGIHPLKELEFGASLYQGEDIPAGGAKSQARNRYGFDGHFVTGPLSLTAEYIHGTDAAVQKEGWYAQAGYFVLPKTLQLVAKYDTYYPSGTFKTDRSTIYYGGLNYFFNRWTRLAVDYLDVREQTTQIKNNKLEVQLQVAF